MNKEEFTTRIQEGFFDLAPDMYDEILEAVEHSDENNVWKMDESPSSIYNKLGYKVLSRVAILILVIGLSSGLFGVKNQQVSYVIALDVNPSIQMELNEGYSVCGLNGLNIDGVEFVKELDWKKNSSVEDTLKVITEKLVKDGYLKKNSGILVTLHQNSKNQNYEELKSILDRELEEDVSEYGVDGVAVAFQTVEVETEQTGKDVLKNRMIEEYQLESDEIDGMNIRQMLDYINSKDSKKEEFEEKLVKELGEENDRSEQESTAQQNTMIENGRKQITEQATSEKRTTEQNMTKKKTTEKPQYNKENTAKEKVSSESTEKDKDTEKEPAISDDKNPHKEEKEYMPEQSSEEGVNENREADKKEEIKENTSREHDKPEDNTREKGERNTEERNTDNPRRERTSFIIMEEEESNEQLNNEDDRLNGGGR